MLKTCTVKLMCSFHSSWSASTTSSADRWNKSHVHAQSDWTTKPVHSTETMEASSHLCSHVTPPDSPESEPFPPFPTFFRQAAKHGSIESLQETYLNSWKQDKNSSLSVPLRRRSIETIDSPNSSPQISTFPDSVFYQAIKPSSRRYNLPSTLW